MSCEPEITRKDFLKLPMEQRREILAKQAEAMAETMSEPELLTPEEIIKKQCQFCGHLYLGKCRYEKDKVPQEPLDDCGVFQNDFEPKLKLYVESVIIPARIAEAKRETLEKIADTQEEIDNMVAKAVAEAVKETRDELINADNYIKIFLEWKATEIRAEERAKLIKWLDEPCTEHKTVVIGGSYNHGEIVKRLRCADHRRDCPKCLQSIKELKI